MLVVSPELPVLDPKILKLYYAKDALLANLPVIVFYGPSTTTNSSHSSSRIQAHVLSLAGWESFHRLTISPASPLYTAVNYVPEDQQGDEICRGLAVSLFKYFTGIPEAVKNTLVRPICRPAGLPPAMFSDAHAGKLAADMFEIENVGEVLNHVGNSFFSKVLSWTELDVTLPQGSINKVHLGGESEDCKEVSVADDTSAVTDYGDYASVVGLFGPITFMPTSKLRRAPSKPTAINKSRYLSRDQKELIRREMCELLDTEESYNSKLVDLVDQIAMDFHHAQKQDSFHTAGSDSNDLDSLFPESLMDILKSSTAFTQDIRDVLEQSENDAIVDMQASAETGSILTHDGMRRDPTGTVAFAKILLKWFPKFTAPYQAYIRASQDFPRTLNRLLLDKHSSLAQAVLNVGEQRLRGMLIEPVQRLPRYSLFIDNMANLLPTTHLALTRFLKAKDIIADICSLDNGPPVDNNVIVNRLRDSIGLWPDSCTPAGRLMTAVDVAELEPPFLGASRDSHSCVLLLFPGEVVAIKKANAHSISARGLLAEVDRPSSTSERTLATKGCSSSNIQALAFEDSYQLCDTEFSESQDGRLLHLSCYVDSDSGSAIQDTSRMLPPIVKTFLLQGSYECRASKLTEEIAKARIENRFSESVRENGKWNLHSTNSSPGQIGLLAAVSEEDIPGIGSAADRRSRIWVRLGKTRIQHAIRTGYHDGDLTIYILLIGQDRYVMDVYSAGDMVFTDTVNIETLMPVFQKRLDDIHRMRRQSQNFRAAQVHVAYQQQILQTLPMDLGVEKIKARPIRPVSPVKLISNMLNSGSMKSIGSPVKQRIDKTFARDIPQMLPPTVAASRSRSGSTIHEERSHNKVNLTLGGPTHPKGPLARLETIFAAYIMSLHSRSGNIVGRVIRGRANADELAVNELYNILIEDPSALQAAAAVSIDVLFSAFEKFMKTAWMERMGPILTDQFLSRVQWMLASTRAGSADSQFRTLLEEIGPQNRRAFSAMIKLLQDLLEACSNDGDRGMLTATFAEVLVLDRNPQGYIPLFDRLVEDYAILFDEPGYSVAASDSLRSDRSTNTGSMSSNASSLRKRFGLGTLSRENSKNNTESKAGSVGSMWRTLSKNTKDESSQPISNSKASLIRSLSTDNGDRSTTSSRPNSRDRPKIFGSFMNQQPSSRPSSSDNNRPHLSSTGEPVPNLISTPRKKRRSSLSDLTAIQPSSPLESWSSIQPRKTIMTPRTNQTELPTPRSSSPAKQLLLPESEGSPTQRGSKDTSPRPIRGTLTERAINRKSDEVVITSLSPQKRQDTHTSIPFFKRTLAERSDTVMNASPATNKLVKSPQKLRLQSPQKLRERLQSEQKSACEADQNLRHELAKIGETMSALNISRGESKTPTREAQALGSRLSAVESKLSSLMSESKAKISSIQKDLESTLLVSERKAKHLDELYREANAENEVLYERFNEELGKVLKGVRSGGGVEEMKIKLLRAQDEASKLKKENARLKRENLGLRSQLKDG
ncbi:hypothetical protein MMC09_006875 [Bachmanniomyces sp. S44760]|nr:hypothetical protein [Bachmanniomyces sp. S44760]